jgi:hypothetical protein
MQSEVIVTAIIFFAAFNIIKLISEHLLKRKLIKAEQYEKVGILEPTKPMNEEANKYPSLKWGLVALMTGLGFILIEVLRQVNPSMINYREAVLPIGIVMVFVSLGFLIYFFIVNGKKK